MFKRHRKLTELEEDRSIANVEMPNWFSIHHIIIKPAQSYDGGERAKLLNVIAERRDTPGSILTCLVQGAVEDKDNLLLLNIVTHKNANKYVLNCALEYVKKEYKNYRSLLRQGHGAITESYIINSIKGTTLKVDSSAYWALILEAIAKHDNAREDSIEKEAINFCRIFGF